MTQVLNPTTADSPTDTPIPGKPFLTFDEARAVLGIGREGMTAALKAGQVPGQMRLGKVWRIRTADLLGVR